MFASTPQPVEGGAGAGGGGGGGDFSMNTPTALLKIITTLLSLLPPALRLRRPSLQHDGTPTCCLIKAIYPHAMPEVLVNYYYGSAICVGESVLCCWPCCVKSAICVGESVLCCWPCCVKSAICVDESVLCCWPRCVKSAICVGERVLCCSPCCVMCAFCVGERVLCCSPCCGLSYPPRARLVLTVKIDERRRGGWV